MRLLSGWDARRERDSRGMTHGCLAGEGLRKKANTRGDLLPAMYMPVAYALLSARRCGGSKCGDGPCHRTYSVSLS
ncbi:hypothetical protein [Leyella lascolaii]|uniref:hypothetical protein n=1 Tax=Leyella lascolaii TaxID=1776379 RepID=UPI0013D96305|nr:hypothetical protein [Leyella lascolaii]